MADFAVNEGVKGIVGLACTGADFLQGDDGTGREVSGLHVACRHAAVQPLILRLPGLHPGIKQGHDFLSIQSQARRVAAQVASGKNRLWQLQEAFGFKQLQRSFAHLRHF